MSITPNFDYSNFEKKKMMDVIRPIGNLFCKTYYKVKFEGLENIDRNDAFIIAPNHVTEFDPLFVAMASKRLFYYIAKAELFKNPILNKAIRGLNGFPIVRGIGDKNALNYAVEIIKRERGDAEKLIEQFMLTANEAVATLLNKRGIPCVYRVHEPSPVDKKQDFILYMQNLGFDTRGISKEDATAQDYSQLLYEAEKEI